MSYTRKAVWGVSTIILLHLVAALLGYAFRFILARKLTVEEYGLFFSVLAFFLLFSTVKDLGIGNALVITLPKLRLQKKWGLIKSALLHAYRFKLVFALLLSVAFWLLAPFLSEHLFKTTEATSLLRIMAVVFFLSVNEEIFSSTFLGFQKYAHYACVELFKKTLLLIGLFVFLHYGLRAPVYAYLLTAILLPIALYPLFVKTFPFRRYATELVAFKPLLLLGLPFVLNTLTYSIVGYFDTLWLTYTRTLHEVGLYNAALPTAMAVLYFMYAFDSVIQPMSSELYHAKKKNKLTLGLEILHKYLFIGIAIVTLLVLNYADVVLRVLYGHEFVGGQHALQILMIGVLCYSIALVNLSVLSGIGQPKVVAKIMLWAAMLNIVLNLFLIPLWGMLGAAFTTVLSYALALLLSYQHLHRNIPLQLPWKEWVKTGVLAALLGLGLYGVKNSLTLSPWIEVPTLVLSTTFLYILLIFALRIVQWEEVKMLWREVTRR